MTAPVSKVSELPPITKDEHAGVLESHGKRRVAALPNRLLRVLRSSGFLGIFGIFAFLAIWEVFALKLNQPILLATVTSVAADLYHWIVSGQIWPQLKTTMTELVCGYLLGMVIGLTFGMVMALSETTRRLLSPLVVGINAAPALALAPLLLIWFGFGIWAKLLLVTFVTIFPIVVNTQLGMTGTDPGLIEVARSFDASRWKVITQVRVPAALPSILASFVVAITRATASVFAAELFGAASGIGYTIYDAAQLFDTKRVFSGILVLSALGILMTWLVGLLAKKLTPWYGQGR